MAVELLRVDPHARSSRGWRCESSQCVEESSKSVLWILSQTANQLLFVSIRHCSQHCTQAISRWPQSEAFSIQRTPRHPDPANDSSRWAVKSWLFIARRSL